MIIVLIVRQKKIVCALAQIYNFVVVFKPNYVCSANCNMYYQTGGLYFKRFLFLKAET